MADDLLVGAAEIAEYEPERPAWLVEATSPGR
jgi:hypothetical protein